MHIEKQTKLHRRDIGAAVAVHIAEALVEGAINTVFGPAEDTDVSLGSVSLLEPAWTGDHDAVRWLDKL